jgi:eukaryotic-like serine/threonine-protein kinase
MVASTVETLIVRDCTERMFAPLRTGTYVGTYRILDLIGQGAIGLVYLAEHDKLKRRVALKVLREELASNEKAVARFFGEARAVNAIAHENIVEITDFVEADPERGVPNHYVMELLHGRTIKEVMEQEDLTIDRIVFIGMQIASALDAVHRQQIVHRDLKPANIFLVEQGRTRDFVKLLDFGVAKLSTSLVGSPLDTGSGIIIGTPGYMAPEQIMGEAIDPRADIYGLGVVLYEMTTGLSPFAKEDILELLYAHCEDPVPPPEAVEGREHIPRRLARLILDCLAKDPAARPQSGAEVFERLREVRRHRRWKKRLIAAALMSAALALVAFVLPPERETVALPVPPSPRPVMVTNTVTETVRELVPERCTAEVAAPKPKAKPKPNRQPISRVELMNPFE